LSDIGDDDRLCEMEGGKLVSVDGSTERESCSGGDDIANAELEVLLGCEY